MFAERFFNVRMFARRFFPKVGADAGPVDPMGEITPDGARSYLGGSAVISALGGGVAVSTLGGSIAGSEVGGSIA
jgi:hypothetical protein